jgi:ligand-binding sensor domain-containing protein/signal transduction histidine kinase
MPWGDIPALAAVLLAGVMWLCSPLFGFAESTPVSMSDEFVAFGYGKEHGLPDNQVRDILQTHDGYLWILTQQGLARFDGTKFTVFDHANTPELNNDVAYAMAEDIEGNLGISGKGLLLRMSGNTFRRVVPEGGPNVGEAFKLCSSQTGGFWAGGGTHVARAKDNALTVFGSERGLNPANAVWALREDAAGTLFVGTMNGLFRFDAQRQRFESIAPGPRAHFKPAVALALHQGRFGTFWGMFADMNASRSWFELSAWIEGRRGDSWELPAAIGGNNFPIEVGTQFILEDNRGQVWVSAPRNQLHRLRGEKFETLTMSFPRGPDGAMCLCEDHEGNLWMGTGLSGLWRWQPRRIVTFSTANGLPQNNSWALCEGLDGSVWVGTDGGLSRFSAGRWETWRTAQGLSRDNVRALAVDKEGTLWVGTSEGLNSVREGKITQHPFAGAWFEGKIRAILPTRDGALWVAGATALHRLADGQQTKFTVADGLASNDVRALLEDSTGRLWIGTYGSGLQCYEHGHFTTYSTTNGLSNGYVWALHQDAEGALWIGTESGLHCLRNGRITTFGKAQGLSDNLVNSILEDDLGQLWISHDRGIYRVRRASLIDLAEGRTNAVRCVSYTTADGLPSEETNGQKSYPAACKTRDGRLWFATTKGVAVIDPKLHHEEREVPPVVIERFSATGDLVFTRDPQDPLLKQRPLPSAIPGEGFRLPPGSGRVIEFDFAANTFVSADRTRYKYRLLGMAEKWIDGGTRRQALFTDLKPGAYRFQVIAANHHGVWNETGADCSFQIAPFFHETWWFYVLCAGMTIAVAGSIVVWRVGELRRIHRLEQQAAIAAERTRIAQDLHDGLGADLTRLTMLADQVSGSPSQSSGEQLRKLSQSSREAARELKDLIWMANPANDTLESFLNRLCQNAEDFLRDARMRCRFDFAPDLPDRPLSLDQRRNLLLVAREAVNNIVKHSGASEVTIGVHAGPGHLDLSIRDNGCGFDPSTARAGALGLKGMRQRIESLGGTLHLESSPGTGTRILIEIKWQKPAHAEPQT